jgi:threonine dehydrogenase-like Zn-dependent dehydrogenase
LLEPLSVVEKAFRIAEVIQQRLVTWQPLTAVVLGAGPIGLLGTLLLRSQGIDVVTVARTPAPNPAADFVAAAGARYVSTRETRLEELATALPNIDLIFECTGRSGPVFDAMRMLGGNGVLVLLSITGGDSSARIPADAINRGMVLGNKVVIGSVNAAHEDFVSGVAHLGQFESQWPGLTLSLITHRLHGFENYERIRDASVDGIKAVVELATA